MSVGIVSAGGVHDFGKGFVCHELQCREWHRHAQCCGVGNVECANALGAENLSGALRNGLVYRAVHLHALFYDCEVQQARDAVVVCLLPSNGFINASLEMVAAAPLAAIDS
jgi:hypothetical protein